MHSLTNAPDVIVVGGGVIGLSIAWELSRHGLSVRVLEQGQFGQEASWAGAGMLPPGNPEKARTTEARLRSGSHLLWPDWSQRLRELTGIDNGFQRCGGIELIHPPARDLQDEVMAWRDEGVLVEPLSRAELQQRIPALNPDLGGGYLLPELGQVRNPRHLKALFQACAANGVELRSGCPVFEILTDGDRVSALRTVDGDQPAGQYIVAGGAWSQSLLQRAGCHLQIEPVRGQIVLLEARPALFQPVLQVGSRYLVPRSDGRILIGSTEEHAGFDKRTTADGVRQLLEFGQELVPALRDARFERCWAGLRPCAPGGLPRIGRLPRFRNLSVAAGHFRAGLQLSPYSAVLIRQIILNQPQSDWTSDLAVK